jgi:hypothetical protein
MTKQLVHPVLSNAEKFPLRAPWANVQGGGEPPAPNPLTAVDPPELLRRGLSVNLSLRQDAPLSTADQEPCPVN